MKRYLIASFAILLTAICSFPSQPERGYRGFVDWTNRIGHDHFGGLSSTPYSPGISTSHGYQFNPWLFAGAGIDYSLSDGGGGYYYAPRHSYDLHNYFLSIFGQVRTDLQFGKLTPFADVRFGWNATSTGTIYFSPSIGYRFNWGRKIGINVGVGYTLDAYRYEEYKVVDTIYGYQTMIPTGEKINYNKSSFTFRVGIDF